MCDSNIELNSPGKNIATNNSAHNMIRSEQPHSVPVICVYLLCINRLSPFVRAMCVIHLHGIIGRAHATTMYDGSSIVSYVTPADVVRRDVLPKPRAPNHISHTTHEIDSTTSSQLNL